jgi:predicted RNA-binding Zn-ribbon protein involved in translation (DUF1610 family)
MIVYGILAGLGAGLIVLLIALLAPRKNCPNCGEKLPRFRKAANRQQAMWGGMNCPNCGVEVDRAGRLVQASQGRPGSPELGPEAFQAAQERQAALELARQERHRQSRARALSLLGWLLTVVFGIVAIAMGFYAASPQAAEAAKDGGIFVAILPLLCSLPFVALGIWLILRGKKRQNAA